MFVVYLFRSLLFFFCPERQEMNMHVIAVEAKFSKLECMCIQRRAQKIFFLGGGGVKGGLVIGTGPKGFEKKRGGG